MLISTSLFTNVQYNLSTYDLMIFKQTTYDLMIFKQTDQISWFYLQRRLVYFNQSPRFASSSRSCLRGPELGLGLRHIAHNIAKQIIVIEYRLVKPCHLILAIKGHQTWAPHEILTLPFMTEIWHKNVFPDTPKLQSLNSKSLKAFNHY